MRTLRVAVVGCGPAGAAAALLLQRDGHRVTVFERVSELKPIGAGILLQPTGMAVIQQLGLAGKVLELGSPVRELSGCTVRGRRVLHLRYEDLGADSYGVGIHRGSLFALLHDAVAKEGIELQRSVEVDSLDRICTEFDLVVVADGARSSLRPKHLISRDKQYEWGAIWTSVRDNEGKFADTLSQVYDGTRRMVGFLPTGWLLEKQGAPLVSVFWSIKWRDADEWRRNLSGWKEQVLSIAPHAEGLLAQIQSMDQVAIVPYYDCRMNSWHYQNAVFIGDSAHAMSPQLGQGANLALLDALFLRTVIRDGGWLEDYSRARRSHVKYYQLASSALTPLFQSDSRVYAPVRNLLFPALTYVPITRRIMLETLAGIRTGFFSRLRLPQGIGQT